MKKLVLKAATLCQLKEASLNLFSNCITRGGAEIPVSIQRQFFGFVLSFS